MNISDVAKKTGLTSKAIRFYEEKGLVTPPLRSENGYRTYSQQHLDELTLLRQQSAEVIRQTTTGIRVPKEALRVRERTVTDEDGNESVVSETGVYCMVGMKARFKPVDVLYSGDDFALVRSTLDTAEEVSKTLEQIRLRAGDEVIITAYDLYDGKVIGS